MDLMEARRRILIGQPHPVTLSGGLVHFQTDVDGLMQITGTGNITVCEFNLFDKTAVTAKRYLDTAGNLVTNDYWNITDYIPVSGAGSIRYWRIGSSGNAPQCAWYDANKNLISTWKHYDCTEKTRPDGYVQTVPANAAFARMSINNPGIETAVIVYGSDAVSGYTAYTGTTAPAGTARKSLVGINNIWSDDGSDITVTYWTH